MVYIVNVYIDGSAEFRVITGKVYLFYCFCNKICYFREQYIIFAAILERSV